jgi:heterotetrameric sarcosine oxidase gamma subunit
MFESHSALEGRIAGGGRDGALGQRALRLTEIRGRHLVQLGLFGSGTSEMDPKVLALTGAVLPRASNEVTVAGTHRLYRIAPDQYWIVSQGARVARSLAREIAPEAGTVTLLTSARVCLAIEGPEAAALLAHHLPLDLEEREFPAGRFAQSGIDHVGVLVERRARDGFELYMLRTFAASIFDALIDTALQYGYDLGVETVSSDPSEQSATQ